MIMEFLKQVQRILSAYQNRRPDMPGHWHRLAIDVLAQWFHTWCVRSKKELCHARDQSCAD
jgi:hypothetical protein